MYAKDEGGKIDENDPTMFDIVRGNFDISAS